MDYFILQLLVQFINSISLVIALIPDGAAAVGFVFVYDKLSGVTVLIDTKSPGLLVVDSDKESCCLRWRKLSILVPFFQFFYCTGLFVALMV